MLREITIDDLPLQRHNLIDDLAPRLPDGRIDLRAFASNVRPTQTGWRFETPSTAIGDWLNENATALFIGAGLLFVFAIAKGKR